MGQEFKPSSAGQLLPDATANCLSCPALPCRPPALPCGSSPSSVGQTHSKDQSCHQQVIDMLAPIPKGSRLSQRTHTRVFWNLKPDFCLSRTFWGNQLLSRAFVCCVQTSDFHQGGVGIWVLLADMLPVLGIYRHASRPGECLKARPVPSLGSPSGASLTAIILFLPQQPPCGSKPRSLLPGDFCCSSSFCMDPAPRVFPRLLLLLADLHSGVTSARSLPNLATLSHAPVRFLHNTYCGLISLLTCLASHKEVRPWEQELWLVTVCLSRSWHLRASCDRGRDRGIDFRGQRRTHLLFMEALRQGMGRKVAIGLVFAFRSGWQRNFHFWPHTKFSYVYFDILREFLNSAPR